MDELNSVLVEGTATVDPESKAEGTCYFAIANKNKGEVTHIDVMCGGEMARAMMLALKKGRRVRVVGRMAVEASEGSDRPFARRWTYIRAQHVEFRAQSYTKAEEEGMSGPDGPVAESSDGYRIRGDEV